MPKLIPKRFTTLRIGDRFELHREIETDDEWLSYEKVGKERYVMHFRCNPDGPPMHFHMQSFRQNVYVSENYKMASDLRREGLDINLDTCIGEGYLIIEYDAVLSNCALPLNTQFTIIRCNNGSMTSPDAISISINELLDDHYYPHMKAIDELCDCAGKWGNDGQEYHISDALNLATDCHNLFSLFV